MTDHAPAPVHILWTGGWDSTFQLLRLLLVHRLPVQPIYLIDDKRKSLDVELRTMQRIRDELATRYPQTRSLLRPTWTAKVSEIRPDPEVDAAWARLNAIEPLGTQYAWLGRFCREHGLREVETGFEKTRNGAGALLTDLGEPGVSAHGYPVDRIGKQYDDAQTVFGYYAFPLFHITKQDMAREVDQRGWRPIMLATWFCHRPDAMQPCGVCNPCVGVIKAGLGWRIPLARRVYGAVHRATVGLAKRTAKRLLEAFRRPRAATATNG